MKLFAGLFVFWGVVAIFLGVDGIRGWFACTPAAPLRCGFHLVYAAAQWSLGAIGVVAAIAIWGLCREGGE